MMTEHGRFLAFEIGSMWFNTDAAILEIGGMLHFIGHSGQVFSASKDRLDAEGSPFHWFQFRLSSTTENCWKPILS